ncbi:MAG: DUF362 domain-containing protein [Candidatus Omnitrophota bacterium]
MTNVSIVKCKGYGLNKLIESIENSLKFLGGIEKFIQPGQKVLLKPNLLKIAHPDTAVTTHPEFIRAVVKVVKKKTPHIFIGDSPGGLIKIDELYDQCGILKIVQDENIKLVKFDNIVMSGEIPFARVKDEVDVIVSLPKFKTHNLTMITAAVKNMFGLVAGLYKVQCHKQAPNFRVFAKELARIYGMVKPHLTIMDAVVAMQGPGPAAGDPYPLNLILAGDDAVALDAVITKIIGVDPFVVPTTKEAAALNLGEGNLKKINICGEPLEKVRVFDFKLPQIMMLGKIPNFIAAALLRLIPLMMSIDDLKCNKCLMCKDICPQGAISRQKGKMKINFKHCILCLCCSEICPANAVYLRFLRRRKVEKHNSYC